ncbi:MAG: branched-chain amino acid ABC transporter substrate-binding protein [Rhodospirillales bacterium]|nr:branched-chain amino acid ABC transporter substrate-binding protein [Rhodospirillales bacterium]
MFATTAATAAMGGLAATPALAADKTITVGIDLSLTGADAESATRIKNGAVLAFDQANEKNEIPGYKIKILTLDDGTATAGQYDPAQAATNARKMVSDPNVVAAVGPQMSGAGKAMAPILSQGGLAIITPSSTNPDITNPKFAAQFDPSGKPIYFRTVTTDAYQGPNMANYYAEVLHVKSVYILDDSGAYGVGLADAFEGQAKKKGIKVLGRDRLDPKAADYTTVLTKIKALNPQAIYYGGVLQAGVKLVKQSYDIIPHVIKGGGDGLVGPEMLTSAGYPANQGWYATIAAPHLTGSPKLANWIKEYKAKFSMAPDDYAITAYDGGMVIVAAAKKLVAEGKPVNRANMRDAIQGIKIDTLQGPISFDAHGDMASHTVSVFQVKQDPNYAADDMDHQFKYLGVAPQS